MRFSNVVIFRIINKQAKMLVPNIAVSLILFAHKKNNYYIGPEISNNYGLISFEKKDCIKKITNSKKSYLMDYFFTLEEFLPKVAIKTKPKEEIYFAIKNMRLYRNIYENYWDCSEGDLKVLDSTDNIKYTLKTYY